MSASMNMEEAKKIAEEMSFEDAVYNALRGKCIPYRKATEYKLKELLEIAEKIDKNIILSGGKMEEKRRLADFSVKELYLLHEALVDKGFYNLSGEVNREIREREKTDKTIIL